MGVRWVGPYPPPFGLASGNGMLWSYSMIWLYGWLELRQIDANLDGPATWNRLETHDSMDVIQNSCHPKIIIREYFN